MTELVIKYNATKDKLPEINQRCLILSIELDKPAFGYHAHHGYFDCAYSVSFRRVYADYWIDDKKLVPGLHTSD